MALELEYLTGFGVQNLVALLQSPWFAMSSRYRREFVYVLCVNIVFFFISASSTLDIKNPAQNDR